MESIIAKVMELQNKENTNIPLYEKQLRDAESGIQNMLNAIYLYDDKVLITFNYKEGTQTVTFGEATEVASEGNGSDLDCFTALLNGSFQKGCRFSFTRSPFGNFLSADKRT